MMIVTEDRTMLMLLRKPRSKWYRLCCVGRKEHYCKDGSCKHTKYLMTILVPSVKERTRLDGWGGKTPNYSLPGMKAEGDEERVMEWQDIATAPKNDTPIDIWSSSWGGERCTNMRRVDLGCGNIFYESAEHGSGCVRDATHWMPIPDNPIIGEPA